MSQFIRIVRTIAAFSSFSALYGADERNAELTSSDGQTKICIGRNLGIQEQIDKKLQDDGIYKEIYMNSPFTTEGLEETVEDLRQEHAEWGTQVHLNVHTSRVLRNKKGKKIIEKAANSGLFNFYNSGKLHDKQALFIEKSEGVEKPSGTLFFGSGNIGSQNATSKNEEVWLVSTKPEDLAQAKAILEGYKSVTHPYDGGTPHYTPKKDKIAWQKREKKVQSPNPKVFSTIDTDIQETRRKMVTQEGTSEVYVESMTGCPDYLASVPASVPVYVTVDKTAIKPHEAGWKNLLHNNPNIQLNVRTNSSSSHHAKITAVKAGDRCLVEVSTANNTKSSADDLNSSHIVEVKTLSPLKRRHEQLSKEDNFVRGSPTLTKVLARLSTESAYEPATKKRKIAAAPITTTTTIQPTKRKLTFGDK